jgi:hypothetical protein
MGIDSEIPPGQSSNDWGPLTLQHYGASQYQSFEECVAL